MREAGNVVGISLSYQLRTYSLLKPLFQAFPGGPVVKTPPSTAGGMGSIPGQGIHFLSLCEFKFLTCVVFLLPENFLERFLWIKPSLHFPFTFEG